MIEINGVANIITFIRLYRMQYRETPEHLESLLKRIETEAFDTIKYLQRLDNPSKVEWHQIKTENQPQPQGEMQ